ncbi:hypothetical protein Pla123a_13230 [Posidoniimonas polymericola]|uniref:Cytochrome P460 domain-containing protein n=2 Tax=Posidoniimonas polymericola TaxID=2528002 RepID=A0A5C5YUM3_9BACT|nr:hypothetical protein Pla123a_13230 [Posidoniimonas polymericola]
MTVAGCSADRYDNPAGPNSTPPTDSISVEAAASGYETMNLMTAEPAVVNAELSALCVGVNDYHAAQARGRSGPHAHTAIKVYMNDSAANHFRGQQAPYPVGSIIVKEKQGMPYQDTTHDPWTEAHTHGGVGGMIKRVPGYNPLHGDWEYFYREDSNGLEQGKIASCISCHDNAADRDCVFGGWDKPPLSNSQ